ncbi:MAG: 1-phosphofructokinase family hexose kinase [Bacteroidetes bacterium]|nr:1-phosphofructokinase family hexose kinase [Bacteroidota bacterium]MBS1929544.1 1-phosphofructokinase family hexose kinase [Bacteroidota bacterium]
MSRIITLTLSPCIDRSMSVPKLVPEKKLKCSAPKLEPGGGGINVARAIKKLGGDAIAIYPAGGYTGKHFNSLLENEEVPVVIIEAKNETRENIIVLDESANVQYRFGTPGSVLQDSEWKKMLEAVEGMTAVNNFEFIVASGSLPPGVPVDIYGQLAVIAKKKKTKLVVDTSGEALKYAAHEGVYMLKPNLGELGALIGADWIELEDVEKIGKQLIEERCCEILVVSMGKDGAKLITKNDSYHFLSPVVKRNSVVGAGDSMVAGIVLALSREKNLKDALKYGVACGTAATMNQGTELCRKEDADKLFKNLIETIN